MDSDTLERIKRLIIGALVSDDLLMGILVLKGGNALNVAYDISNRGSVDIDFSIEKDFTDAEKNRLRNQFDSILNQEFSKENYTVFDVKFEERPNVMDDAVKDFWGGYLLKFKIIDSAFFNANSDNLVKLQRNAMPVGKNGSTNFTVDISKYEFVGNKKPFDLEGSVVYVYTPEMIVLEKLRAICQQMEDYRKIVFKMTSSPRARDFYDIHNLCTHFTLDFNSTENIELAKIIFGSKKVPMNFISLMDEQFELHRENWESVLQTINQEEDVNDFQYYFDFVKNKFQHLTDR